MNPYSYKINLNLPPQRQEIYPDQIEGIFDLGLNRDIFHPDTPDGYIISMHRIQRDRFEAARLVDHPMGGILREYFTRQTPRGPETITYHSSDAAVLACHFHKRYGRAI